MIGFGDLKEIILRSCRTSNQFAGDINSKFNFTINPAKLEKALNSKSDLHVVAFKPMIESRIPSIDEISTITEYTFKKEDIEIIFNGNTQIATLMLYCDMEGELKINNGEEPVAAKDIFDALNAEKPNIDLIKAIAAEFPMYRCLVVRKFDSRKDKFVYSIYFRSTHPMIIYVNDLKKAGTFKTNKEDAVESTEAENTTESEALDTPADNEKSE